MAQLMRGFMSAVGATLFGSASALAANQSVTADFAAPTGVLAGPFAYGINASDGFDPTIAGTPGDATYKANMAAMAAGILRYHNDEMADSATSSGWVRNPTRSNFAWDEAKIVAAFQGSYDANGYAPVRMIDVDNWPSYLATGQSPCGTVGTLKTTEYKTYANFAAQLVRILNVKHKLGIKYFELFNEMDGNCGNIDVGPYNGHMSELAKIYLLTATAMKRVDPTILIGGPAFRQVSPTTDMDDFFQVAISKLDFVTYHEYGYFNLPAPNDETVFADAVSIGADTTVQTELAKYTSRLPPVMLDEYNMYCCGFDPRVSTFEGAVFDALVTINAISTGHAATMAWSDADGWYGKLNPNAGYSPRPPAYFYQAFNPAMIGPVYTTTPTPRLGTGDIVPFAVKSSTAYSLALINRTGREQTVQAILSGVQNLAPSTAVSVTRVTGTGLTASSVDYDTLSASRGYTVPALSITILSLPIQGH